jgi:hypothetical protein
METRVFLLSGSVAMADMNLQYIRDVLDIFVVKTNVSISHGLQCPDYTILKKEDKTDNYFINTKEKIVMDDNKKRVSYLVADCSGRAGLSVGLGPLGCWDCDFESRLGHGFLSYKYCGLSGRSLCDGPITGPEESYGMCHV